MSQCLINLISSPFLPAIRCGSVVFLPAQSAGSQLIRALQLHLTPSEPCAERCLLGFTATDKLQLIPIALGPVPTFTRWPKHRGVGIQLP